MSSDSLAQLESLWGFLEKFRQIERKLHTADGTRLENDAEHSFNLAMLAWFLAKDRPELDTGKVIQLSLVHDLIEVHAGDTAFFERKEMKSKEKLEREAVERITKDWKQFPDLSQCINEYETRRTPEAKFVYALDKIAPMLNNYLTEAVSWRHFKIPYAAIKTYKRDKVALDPQVLRIYDELVAYFDAHPELHYDE